MNGPLRGERIVPVVVLHDAADAHPLADALVAGGIRCAEITLRTPAGIDAIRALRDRDDIRITHIGEMSAPEVRAVIWAKVEEITDAVRRGDFDQGKPA